MRFEHMSCNICGSDRTGFIGKRIPPDGNKDMETNIVRCRFCGLMYPNPMPRIEYDEIQKEVNRHEQHFTTAITEGDIREYKNVLNLLEEKKPGRGKLLDVGCGVGELVYAARKRGWQAVGTEISGYFARYAKEKFGIPMLVGDISDLGLPQESFDVISLSSVIQYVQNPLATLKKINQLLKKDGILYIEVTNEDALIFKAGDFFKSMKGRRRLTTHLSPLFSSFQIYGFSEKTLSFALEKADFGIIYIQIKGIAGGGKIKGRGLTSKVINFVRKIIVLIGGLTGKGHLIYCMARKV